MFESVTIFGLGEAGSLFATDLIERGVRVQGYDPDSSKPTPRGVERVEKPAHLKDANAILSFTAAADARQALAQVSDAQGVPGGIQPKTLYADYASAAPQLKKELAGLATRIGLVFADVALMDIVPGNGLLARCLVSGVGARLLEDGLAPWGVPLETVSDNPGDAAARKLLRSVVVKGLAALTIESMRAAEKLGVAQEHWQSLSEQIERADENFLRRLVEGTGAHALRRLHEMEATREMLSGVGVEPVMTESTVASLRALQSKQANVPEVPQ